MNTLIDTHCHLDFEQFQADRDAAIRRAHDAHLEAMINVGSSVQSSINSCQLAGQHPSVYFSVGIHPHYADEFAEETLNSLEKVTSDAKLVAIGEIGLDYFKSRSTKQAQQKVFRAFLQLAKKKGLPVIIHCRESEEDTLRALREEKFDFSQVVFHCFSGSAQFLDDCLREGAMVSFTANITYPKAIELRQQVQRISLERLMLETDAPFLAPQKFRGQRNEPSYLHLVTQEVAVLKKVDVDEVARITTENAKKFFRLPTLLRASS